MKPNESTEDSLIDIHVILLDDRRESFKMHERCLGQQLFNCVVYKIGVFDFDYFDLLYTDFEGNYCWLDRNRPLIKPLRNSLVRPLEFLFGVKFYTPYPNLIIDDLTRYLYALQIKNDFFQGLLHSNRNTSLLLAAFIVQSQLGDFVQSECKSYAYLKKHHILRTAPDSYLMRLMELHQTLVGLSKSESDCRLLDAARKVELYGIRLHAAKDSEEHIVNLGVNHSGINIFENFTRVNTFNWSMIRKLSFKRRKLLIKLHMEAYGYGNDTIEFSFNTRNGCKNFWKKCIEQHAFFRSMSPYEKTTVRVTDSHSTSRSDHPTASGRRAHSTRKLHRSSSCGANGLSNRHEVNTVISDGVIENGRISHKSGTFKRFPRLRLTGSSYRYSGRTHKQLIESVYDKSLNPNSVGNGVPSRHMVRPYTEQKSSNLSKSLTKLLSQNYPSAGEHFDLLRLSFSSLIPDSSSENIFQNTPTLSNRQSLKLTLSERSSSTLSIDRHLSRKQKSSNPSFVPRYYSGTLSRQSSTTLENVVNSQNKTDQLINTIVNSHDNDSGTIPNWPSSNYYFQQSGSTAQTFDDPGVQHFAKDQTNLQKLGTFNSIGSSSCSLSSDNYPQPVCDSEERMDFLQSPTTELPNLNTMEQISVDDDHSPISVLPGGIGLQDVRESSLKISSPRISLSGPSNNNMMEMGPNRECNHRSSLVGSVHSISVTKYNETHNLPDTALLNNNCRSDPDFVLLTSGSQSTNDNSELTPKSHVRSFVSSCNQAEFYDTDAELYSDQMDRFYQAPESLADALSLGAISMVTGLSWDEVDDLSESRTEQAESILNECMHKKIKCNHSTSLTQLRVEKMNQANSPNLFNDIDVDIKHGIVPFYTLHSLNRTKSEPFVKQITSIYEYDHNHSDHLSPGYSNDHSPLSVHSMHHIITESMDETIIVQQKVNQTVSIASKLLKSLRDILHSERMYNRDLQNFSMLPVDAAIFFKSTTFLKWFNCHIIPLLQPLVEKEVYFIRQIETAVNNLKRLIHKIKVISKRYKLKLNGTVNPNYTTVPDLERTKLVKCNGNNLISSSSSSAQIICHINPKDDDEALSSSEISTGYLPQNTKFKYKRSSLFTTLKELRSATCCDNLHIHLFEQLHFYENWIKTCSQCLVELWFLAFGDFLTTTNSTEHCVLTTKCNRQQQQESRENSAETKVICNCASNLFVNGADDFHTTRKILYDLDRKLPFNGSLFTHFLQPGRRLIQYFSFLQNCLTELPHSFPGHGLCKAVLSHYTSSIANHQAQLDQCETMAFTLQLSTNVFPIANFFNSPNKPDLFLYNTVRSESESDTSNIINQLRSVLTSRPLIRFGQLQKYSLRGFQPRLVILLADRLIYASRVRGVSGLYFKLHGIISLAHTIVEEDVSDKLKQKIIDYQTDFAGSNNQMKADLMDTDSLTVDVRYENSTNVVKDILKFALVVTYTTPTMSVNKLSAAKSYTLCNAEGTKSSSLEKCRLRKHRRRFIFGACNQSQRDAWMSDIRQAVSKLNSVKLENNVTSYSLENSLKNLPSGIVRFSDKSISNTVCAQVTQRCLGSNSGRICRSESMDMQNDQSKPDRISDCFLSSRKSLLAFCWRQESSISVVQLLNSNDCELTDYLLRLSKHGSSWQKLWTVLTNFSLCFYKSPVENKLLATLWLCDYSVSLVSTISTRDRLPKISKKRSIRKTSTQQLQLIKLSNGCKEYYFQTDSESNLIKWYSTLSFILNSAENSRRNILTTCVNSDLKHTELSSSDANLVPAYSSNTN